MKTIQLIKPPAHTQHSSYLPLTTLNLDLFIDHTAVCPQEMTFGMTFHVFTVCNPPPPPQLFFFFFLNLFFSTRQTES